MPTDYAKKKRAKQKTPLVRKRTFWAVVFACLLVLIAYTYRAYQPHMEADAVESVPVYKGEAVSGSGATSVESVPVATTGEAAEDAQPSTSNIQYEFYSVLPQKTEVPVTPEVTAEGSAADAPSLGHRKGYWLQVAAYYTDADAKAYQSRVQLLGYDADIMDIVVDDPSSSHDKKTVFRVMVGPYANYQLAKQHQQELHAAQIDSLIRHIA